MGLQTCIASTDFDLTTTAKVKDLLGTTLTSDDAHLSDLIRRISKMAETYVGYPLVAQAYRETLPGFGSRRLMLGRTPVRAILGFWDSTSSADASTFLTSEYRLDPEEGFIDRDAGWAWSAPYVPAPFSVPLADQPWAGQERPTYMVEYVAGYTRGGLDTGHALYSTTKGTTSTGRTLPEDIEAAVAGRVVSIFNGDESVVEKSVGDLRIRYGTYGSGGGERSSGWPELDAYVRY